MTNQDNFKVGDTFYTRDSYGNLTKHKVLGVTKTLVKHKTYGNTLACKSSDVLAETEETNEIYNNQIKKCKIKKIVDMLKEHIHVALKDEVLDEVYSKLHEVLKVLEK